MQEGLGCLLPGCAARLTPSPHLTLTPSPPPLALQIREGKVGANKLELSAAARAAIQARWEEVMLPASGYAHSYEELRCGINAELKRPFAGGPGMPAAAGALG